MKLETATQLDTLDFSKLNGLLPVVAQHALTGEILMLAFANREALERTLATREMHYYSRSRAALWRKGETSGNVQRLVSLHGDCDSDSVLALVEPTGPSCHTGDYNCFGPAPVLAALAHVLTERAAAMPEGSYTTRLLGDRNLRLKKIGEEAAELVAACADEDQERVRNETADVIYHALVAALAVGVSVEDVLGVLAGRAKK